MAVTFTKTKGSSETGLANSVLGFDVEVGTLNIGASYATGGIAIAATDILSTASTLHDLIITNSEDAVIFYTFDIDNAKVLAYDAIATEESAAVDLSADAKSMRCIAIVS